MGDCETTPRNRARISHHIMLQVECRRKQHFGGSPSNGLYPIFSANQPPSPSDSTAPEEEGGIAERATTAQRATTANDVSLSAGPSSTPPPSPPLATALGSPSHLKHSVCLPHIWPCYREQSSVVTPTLPLRLVGLQLDDLCFRPQRSRNASSEPAQEDEEAGSQVQGGERCYQRGCCNRGG